MTGLVIANIILFAAFVSGFCYGLFRSFRWYGGVYGLRNSLAEGCILAKYPTFQTPLK